jgi:hypothetical protein
LVDFSTAFMANVGEISVSVSCASHFLEPGLVSKYSVRRM